MPPGSTERRHGADWRMKSLMSPTSSPADLTKAIEPSVRPCAPDALHPCCDAIAVSIISYGTANLMRSCRATRRHDERYEHDQQSRAEGRSTACRQASEPSCDMMLNDAHEEDPRSRVGPEADELNMPRPQRCRAIVSSGQQHRSSR